MRLRVAITAALSIVVIVILFGLSWSSLAFNQIGINYDGIFKKVGHRTYLPGRYFLGIGHSFVKYPRTYQTISFSNERDASALPLRSRTSDGLEVTLEISFQFLLEPESLIHLYLLYGENPAAHAVFTRVAQDLLTELATNFTAYDFFTNPTIIRNDMERESDELFQQVAFATVDFFQLQTVELPQRFEAAIQQTEVQKQEIKTASADQSKVTVELQTKVLQAERHAMALVTHAEGQATAVLLQNRADVAAFTLSQQLKAQSYKSILSSLGRNVTSFLEYLAVQALRAHKGSALAVALPPIH